MIAHEFMHGYDVEGRNVDDDGVERDWWNDETTQQFVNKTICLRTAHKEVRLLQAKRCTNDIGFW